IRQEMTLEIKEITPHPYCFNKNCSNCKCGEINKELRYEEVFECSHCDNVIDRDVNYLAWKYVP
ncbi:10027_t:CDS:2, partial [Funneliformis caledonium]